MSDATSPDGDEYDPEDDFVDLVQIQTHLRTRPGALATEIEARGVHGWDRYGRFKKFTPAADKFEVQAALDVVAECMSRRMTLGGQWNDDDEWFDWSRRRFGWRMKDMPNFEEVERAQQDLPRPRETGESKWGNNNLRIIGALVEIITGQGGIQGHPDLNSETKLIDLLTDRYKGFNGLTERTLQGRFRDAKKLLSEP